MSNLTTRATKGDSLTHGELDTNFKRGAQTKAASYTVVEGDNRDAIDVTAVATITLPDATAIVAAADTGDFEVTLNNTTVAVMTITCVTGTDTIDGSTSDYIVNGIDSVTLKVDQAGTGYNIVAGAATKTATETFTNKTLISPIILDANGNESLIIATTASAVNEATLTNAATTNAPSIAATGDDTNIDLQLTGKGTGGVYGTLVRTTAVATTSLSAQTITSIPSWARKITLMFDQVSANGIHSLSVQIGTGGTAETTGYQSVTTEIDAAAIGAQTTNTSGFFASYQSSAAAVISGIMILSNVTGDIWSCTCQTEAETDVSQTLTAGRKSLAGTLDMLSINTTQTFDGGQVNIIYEG